MQQIILQRTHTDDHGTVGRLLLGDEQICFTMEPPWRRNKTNLSCILPGTYLCTWHYSPRFKWCYLVNDVSGRTDVLIHSGNLGGDLKKGLLTHTHGCILLGQRLGFIHAQRAVLLSKKALNRFFELLNTESFELTIRGINHGMV